MNILMYTLMNKINNTRIIDDEYLEELYQYYKNGRNILDYEININKEEFKKIFTVIYDILRLKVTEEEFKIISKNYLKLLMHDALDGHNVDYNWFIDHIWYLYVGSNDIDNEKYKDCILFIQERLIKEFEIKEKVSDKIKRKIFTNYMTR